MATGLLALLDDVAAIAKVAAASLDDVAAQAGKAGAKAAGVVIDDAAVTPRYVVGFAAAREVPIVWRIAVGSARNKILILLPAALILSAFAPWLITPLLVLGGLFLCYEGAEKVHEALFPHAAHGHAAAATTVPQDPVTLENAKVSGAIRTDFILSAEIMAIALATMPQSSLPMQAVVLAVVGLGITVLVYGAVALIVKADDLGVSLAARGGALAPIGRGLVRGMPPFLKLLSVIGTAAMIWVGGGIVIHGLDAFGIHAPGHALHAAEEWGGFLGGAVLSGIAGLVLGAVLIPTTEYILAPLMRGMRRLAGRPAAG